MDENKRRQLTRKNFEVAERVFLQKLRDPDSIPDGAIVIPMSLLATGTNALTPSRWQLLDEVRTHGAYESLQDLADALGRGKHRVSKDVDVLARFRLLHKAKQGREIRIWADLNNIIVA